MDVSKLPLTKRPLRCLGLSSRSVKNPRGRPSSVCGVCGDEAKHIHFGGLCCPSCKAFFRRVVQLNLKDSLTCSLSNNCSITVKNRRDCPTCRFKKCESIGMLLNWVMPEEERKRMMERRIVATKRILGRNCDGKEPESGSSWNHPESCLRSPTASNENSEASIEANQIINDTNETSVPNSKVTETKKTKIFEDEETIVKQEIKVEEELLETPPSCIPEDRTPLRLTLSGAFFHCDFPTDSLLDKSERFSQIFFWYCQALSVFFHNIEDLKVLKMDEKSKLIKHAVTRSIFLYSAHQFDNHSQTFPRFKISAKCTFPTVGLKELELFVGNRQVFLEIKSFLATISNMLEDECLTLYLMIISFLTTDDNVSTIAKQLKRKYCKQFEEYLADQKKKKNYKPAQYYYDILEDVDKLAKVFGEMKLPADKIVAKSSFENIGNFVKSEPEEPIIVEDVSVSDTEPQKVESEDLKTIVQIDHDYSMSITLEEFNHTNQHKLSHSIRKNQAETEHLQRNSWKLKQHRHPFYQKTNKSCNRSCCNEANFYRKRNVSGGISTRYLELQTSCPPEYQRHIAHHMSNFETTHYVPGHTVYPQLRCEEYLPNHISKLEDEHFRGQCKCYRKQPCCPSPDSSFQRFEPIWDNCTISHHRWPQHYHPTKESRSCCHVPWSHSGIERCQHN